MSAIDHKAEAEMLLRIEHNTDNIELARDAAKAAQAHATLALVKQTAALVAEQRTANLIANMNADQSAGYGIPKERLLEIQERLA
jgi:hypothetical protein